MVPVSWAIIGAVALVTGATTYFVTRHVANNDNEQLKEQINSQIVISQEKDNSHEFAQTVILAIILVILVLVGIYWCLRCAMRAVLTQAQVQQQQIQRPQNQPQQQPLNQIIP